jgi:hypothetical protein
LLAHQEIVKILLGDVMPIVFVDHEKELSMGASTCGLNIGILCQLNPMTPNQTLMIWMDSLKVISRFISL